MLGLKTIKRQRIPFDLGDRFIYFRTKADFDIPELAAWSSNIQRLTKIKDERDKARNEGKHTDLQRQGDQIALEMIHLILPDFPSEQLSQLKAGQIDQLAGICISVAGGTYQNQAADVDQLSEIGEKFPDLPANFLATLTRNQAWLLVPPMAEETADPN